MPRERREVGELIVRQVSCVRLSGAMIGISLSPVFAVDSPPGCIDASPCRPVIGLSPTDRMLIARDQCGLVRVSRR